MFTVAGKAAFCVPLAFLRAIQTPSEGNLSLVRLLNGKGNITREVAVMSLGEPDTRKWDRAERGSTLGRQRTRLPSRKIFKTELRRRRKFHVFVESLCRGGRGRRLLPPSPPSAIGLLSPAPAAAQPRAWPLRGLRGPLPSCPSGTPSTAKSNTGTGATKMRPTLDPTSGSGTSLPSVPS